MQITTTIRAARRALAGAQREVVADIHHIITETHAGAVVAVALIIAAALCLISGGAP